MRTIIDYLRSCFCNHDWFIEENWVKNTDYDGTTTRQGTKVYMRCKTCGHHKKHWKT